jgi:iron complex transport system ATP-binding protein
MGVSLLEVRDVSYALNGKKILERVSWTVRRGEHWAILGPNGAGKTTLLKIVCGYLWPNAGGKVYRNGESSIDMGRLRRSIGWVTSTLYTDIPAGEPVLDTVVSGKYAQLGLWTFSWEKPTHDDIAAARGHLSALGCARLAGRTFGSLSQGEQQKVLICRSLMAAPYLLILDEPCAGMDPGARETFLAALLSLGRKGDLPALVYVTHHPEEILPIFNRTLVLSKGKVAAKGETGAILTAPTLKRLYGVSVELMKRNGRYWPVPK